MSTMIPSKCLSPSPYSCGRGKLRLLQRAAVSRSTYNKLAGIAHPVGRRWNRRRGKVCSASTEFEDFVQAVQEDICTEVAAFDGSGKSFIHDKWDRPAGGGFGITRVLQDGNLLEKAAANVSIVKGVLTPARAQAMTSRGRIVDPEGGQEYSAAALSLVFHSASPMVPTFRADVRCFQVEGGETWFGGGADLTPYYLFDSDASEFHGFWKKTCDGYDESLYPAYKTWCDEYFYIPARKEHRGVGGIFFDDLTNGGGPASENGGDARVKCDDAQSFTQQVASSLMPSYLPIAERRRSMDYGEEQRRWQLLRRGRYLEFNLLYDRGVRFGLDGGRIESIMVSAPPLIAWEYNVVPEEGSPEANLVAVLQKPKEWA
ncbi:hypothetical protein CYMTET_53418 [Cymbomonas tetramitiformis]|uniref:Coproporphyrinogen oxidase n=1 Tax=Cymbomonas tetramitiformis TaxID=36881 RepID=A0AAE0BIG2_9CHLO|nr:hypothetical protein CYMTET_53418 [Cymbomonas tetramitiformis]